MLCLLQDFSSPLQHYYSGESERDIRLWDADDWLRTRCRGDQNCLVQFWEPEVGNWRLCMASHIVVRPGDAFPTVLLRRNPGTLCAGLGQELARMDQAAGRKYAGTAARVDLRAHLVRPIRVIAWGRVSSSSLLFCCGSGVTA